MEHFDFIDYCVIGEGEKAFEKFIDYANGTEIKENVPSLAYRSGSSVTANALAAPLDVDTLPYLDFDLYDIEPDSLRSMSCETGRGCPYKCTFCSTTSFWGNHFRVKSPERLAREIKHYRRMNAGIQHFDFHSHDNFLTNKEYIRQLFDELRKEDLEITWNCSSRIDRLDDEFIDLLEACGCRYIDCGPESGSPRVRKLIQKDINYGNTKQNIGKLLNRNIGVAVNFMFGFPTETRKEMENSFEEACICNELGANIVFCFLSPLKGTKIYENFESRLRDKKEEHLHDFTDTRANFLYGTRAFRESHPFFSNQLKMFENSMEYNRAVKEIRKVDSVHIFTYLSDFLLVLKKQLGIDIYQAKAAMQTFPYTKDLFKFTVEQARNKNIGIGTLIHLLCGVIREKEKKKRQAFEDITMLLCFDRELSKGRVIISEEDQAFIIRRINTFYNKNLGLGRCRFDNLKQIGTFRLDSAFVVKQFKKLFMRFTDTESSGSILTSVGIEGPQKFKVFHHNRDLVQKETELLQNLENIMTGGGNESHAN